MARQTPPAAGGRPPRRQPQKPSSAAKKQAIPTGEIDYDYERSVQFANRGCLVAFVAVFLVLAIALLGFFIYVRGELSGGNATATGTVTLQIPAGSGGQKIAGLLKDAGLIGNEAVFRFYVRINGTRGWMSGDYEIEAGTSYDDIIEMITGSTTEKETTWVTIPEGSTIYQFAARCEEAGICSADAFLEEARTGDFSDIPFMKYLDYDPHTFMKLEGYLAADTYEFYKDENPNTVIRRLLNQFNKNLETISFIADGKEIGIYEQLERQGITLRQAITLASLVEEEASKPDENQALVAGVFWNRLTKENSEIPTGSMGSDVTLLYLRDFVSRGYGSGPEDFTDMTHAQIKERLLQIMPAEVFYAYFTGDDDPETRSGLPAGPISSPSITAIRAALQPENHNYYYFITSEEGNYYYARTYNEHQRNIQKVAEENEAYRAGQGTGG